ncbi:hypothetical protein ACIPF8_18640 [Collimonas sp. NPDC087041]
MELPPTLDAVIAKIGLFICSDGDARRFHEASTQSNELHVVMQIDVK